MRRGGERAELLPLLGLAGAVLLWGTSFVAIKAALEGFGPLPIIGIRMLIASALMAPLWARLPSPERRPGDVRWLIAVALLWPCVYYALEGNALRLTTASQAGAISALVPLLVAVGARLFLAERLSRRAAIGLLVSIAGVVALSVGASAGDSAPDPVLGNALEVAAMVSYACSTLILKRLTSRYNPWLLTGIQCLAGAAVFLPLVVLSVPDWGHVPATAVAGVVYLGLLVTLLPAGLYNYAVSRMPAARAAIAINVTPVVALFAGWAVLSDSLNAVQLVACVAILAGVLFGQSAGRLLPDRLRLPSRGSRTDELIAE